jgi:hypothetical protein
MRSEGQPCTVPFRSDWSAKSLWALTAKNSSAVFVVMTWIALISLCPDICGSLRSLNLSGRLALSMNISKLSLYSCSTSCSPVSGSMIGTHLKNFYLLTPSVPRRIASSSIRARLGEDEGLIQGHHCGNRTSLCVEEHALIWRFELDETRR